MFYVVWLQCVTLVVASYFGYILKTMNTLKWPLTVTIYNITSVYEGCSVSILSLLYNSHIIVMLHIVFSNNSLNKW